MPEVDSEPAPGPEPKPVPRLGSYLLVKALGSGGMSNVFRALHEETGSVVAVKVLPRTLAKNATLLQRFMREAKSAEALDHPNVVAIYDRGFDQGRHYLVLEFVEGRDLHDRVRLNGPLQPAEAVAFIREVAEGLRYAAGQGMIHRDVKPANLLMTPDGHAKIIDLGLALLLEDEDERVTRDGTTVGTVDYMAPEQARDSRQTSERSDIYSLGCTFYYLLTGSPPFPGGGLSDKLARHYKGAIPDVREHRSDVSESLSALIRRMMEKRPEQRYADYTKLIEALDTLDDPPTQDMPGEVFDALIVDDDDDLDEIGLAPTESALTRRRDDRPASSREHPLMAEIVDDDDDDEPPRPTLPPPGPRPRSREVPARPKPAAPVAPAELSIADLAASDADDPPAARRQAQRSSSSASTVNAASNSSQPARPASVAIAAITEEDGEEVYGSEGAPRRGPGAELSLKTWISAGVMVGLAIAILGFGASMVVSLTKPEPIPEAPIRQFDQASKEPDYVPPAFQPNRISAPTVVTKKAKSAEKAQPIPIAVIPVPVIPVVEPTYPTALESKLGPPPTTRPGFPDRPRIVVRRLVQAGNEPQNPSLAAAFSRGGDLVEIADTGPFFEDDCQVAGKSRLIRAKEGVRPMIKIEYTTNPVIKEQAAKFILGGSRADHLVIEGVDIAVDVRDLPDHQTALFLCQGADLTLRDCSLTILNGNDQARTSRFSVFRVEEGAKPNRIVLDRTTIRGTLGSLVDLAAARAEVVFSRSMILGDTAPLIRAEQAENPVRSFYFHRSLLITRGSVIEFLGRPTPPVVRSLGTTFARVDGGTGVGPGLFSSRNSFPGEAPTVLDWSGEDNEFAGWTGWLASGNEMRVAGLDGIRSIWPGSDGSSRESSTPWPAHVKPDAAVPLDFADLAPGRKPTLIKIAAPHPFLRELTIDSLPRLATPELSATLVAPQVAQLSRPGDFAAVAPVPRPAPKPNANAPVPKNPAKAAGPAMKGITPGPPAPPVPLSLTFNLQEAPWLGDLGLYLAEKIVPGTPQATVIVRGSGFHPITPVRLPDGLSIAILGDSIEGGNLPMPTFVPKPGSAGRSMIELHGGDLAIANLGFSTEGSKERPLHWVLSEDGILAIKHCRFRDPANVNAPGVAPPNVGSVIAFVAKGTMPIPMRIGPLVKEVNRPTVRLMNCLIWTAGDAISAEVGRGAMVLDNCLVISGGPAVSLMPSDVARDRFEADLVLDRCTIAVDKTSILLGPMAGDPTGPSRPWLVSTRRCAFPRTQPTGGTGALLQVDPDAMARGVVFWQSSSDFYDNYRFLASIAPQPANPPSTDIKKQWTDLWGQAHTKGDQGPTARRSETVLRYKDGLKPKPGKVLPAALELDLAMTDLGVDFKNLPGTTARPPADGAAAKGAPGVRFERP